MGKYSVLGNLSHDGVDYTKGDVVEMDAAQAESLIADGVIKSGGKGEAPASKKTDEDAPTGKYDSLTNKELIAQIEGRVDEVEAAELTFDPNAKKAVLIELLEKLDAAQAE